MAGITAYEVEIIRLNEKIERLEAIINIYIRPNEFLFDQDDAVSTEARRVVEKKLDKDREALENIPEIKLDLQDLNTKLDALMHKRKPGEVTQKRLKRTDALLVNRNNAPIPFAEMGKLQDFKPRYRDQDMTKLGHIYEQHPDRYEIHGSKLGGKTIKLNSAYYKHLTKGGD